MTTEKLNTAWAKNLTHKDAFLAAKSLSIELAAQTAVAYDSTKCQSAIEAVALDKCCVVVTAECDFGQPFRWGDHTFENGKLVR